MNRIAKFALGAGLLAWPSPSILHANQDGPTLGSGPTGQLPRGGPTDPCYPFKRKIPTTNVKIDAGGQGIVTQVPNKARLVFAVETTEKNQAQSSLMNAQQAKHIREALAEMLSKRDLKKLRSSVNTEEAFKEVGNRSVRNGFTTTQTFDITVSIGVKEAKKNPLALGQKVGEVFDSLNKLGAKGGTAQYGVTNVRALQARAMDLAMRDMEKNATRAAVRMGAQEVRRLSVNVAETSSVVSRHSLGLEMAAARHAPVAATAVDTGLYTVTQSVSGVFRALGAQIIKVAPRLIIK